MAPVVVAQEGTLLDVLKLPPLCLLQLEQPQKTKHTGVSCLLNPMRSAQNVYSHRTQTHSHVQQVTVDISNQSEAEVLLHNKYERRSVSGLALRLTKLFSADIEMFRYQY